MKKAILLSFFLFVVVECALRYTKDIYSIDFMFNWFFLDQRIETLLRSKTIEKMEFGVPLNSSGFRGFWEFDKPHKGVRIIVTGAGHSYADNIPYGQAWPEQVERRLQESGTAAEVWNLSVNGSTVLFIERGFLPSIIESNPDYVVLSHSGYNEAIYSRILEENTLKPNHLLHNLLFASEIFRSSYQFFHNQTTDTFQNKVPITTFSSSYQRIITQLQKSNISIILLQQEVITPDIGIYWKLSELESYRDAFKKIADTYQLPLIDPKELVTGNQEEYFERQEYYNQKMHDKIGDTMGDTIEELIKNQ